MDVIVEGRVSSVYAVLGNGSWAGGQATTCAGSGWHTNGDAGKYELRFVASSSNSFWQQKSVWGEACNRV